MAAFWAMRKRSPSLLPKTISIGRPGSLRRAGRRRTASTGRRSTEAPPYRRARPAPPAGSRRGRGRRRGRRSSRRRELSGRRPAAQLVDVDGDHGSQLVAPYCAYFPRSSVSACSARRRSRGCAPGPASAPTRAATSPRPIRRRVRRRQGKRHVLETLDAPSVSASRRSPCTACSPSSAKQMGTRWSRPSGVREPRRATRAVSARRRASAVHQRSRASRISDSTRLGSSGVRSTSRRAG